MKTVIVTGATSGIGFEVCRRLLSENYGIIGIGSSDKCEKAKQLLQKEFKNADITFFRADLMNFSGQKKFCDELTEFLKKDNRKIFALINNAGCVKGKYGVNDQGYERQFALNHLAGFYITYRLFGFLEQGGKIIFTGSKSHWWAKIKWNNIMLKKFFYNPLTAYKQSKLCNLLFAYELSRRYNSKGIAAYVVDPGLVNTDIGNKNTGRLVSLVWSLRKKHGTSPEIPAKTYAYLCNNTPQGLYFYNSAASPYSKEVTPENALRLFELSEKLCGINYGEIK